MKKLRYVQSYKGYNYFRFPGQPKITLPRGDVGSGEFQAAYRAALAAAQSKAKDRSPPAAKTSAAVGTLRANVTRYLSSALFCALRPSTQTMRRRILMGWCDGTKRTPAYGDLPLVEITSVAFAKMMYARERTPGAQRTFLCAVRHLLKDCKKAQTIDAGFDPTRDQHCGRGQNPEGLKCWPEELVAQYRAYWPSGTMQRLALEVLYESGAACCDAIKLGRDNIVDGLIVFDRQKTGASSFRPFTAALERELAASPVVAITGPWLRTPSQGRPFKSAHDFGLRFAVWAKQAGIPAGYSAHGIRKRAATDLADAGESIHTLMAEFGWNDPDQAIHYTRKSERKRLAMARAERIRTAAKSF
jgi:hypothetical protein